MEGDEVNEGAHGKIFRTVFGVVKIGKRRSKTHDTVAQRRIHSFIEEILSQPRYIVLKTPALSHDLLKYEMKYVNTDEPLWMPNDGAIIRELVWLWEEMWEKGFALYDFELYQQPDNTVIILDFDATGLRIQNNDEVSVYIPGKNVNPNDFFDHMSFPPDFEQYLVNLRLPIGKRNI